LKKYISLAKDPVKLLLTLCFAVFLVLLFRNAGLYPNVFHDEYTYGASSRLFPLSDAPIPCYLYLWIYSFTNYCGDGFLDCARIFNAFFFVSGAIFIFLMARKVASGFMAVLVAVFSILGPFGIYAAYFMPESMYFFAFWFFAWKLMDLRADSGNCEWMAIGFLFGCVSLVKPHSLLLTPAIALYIVYLVCERQNRRAVSIIEKAASFFVPAATAKFLIGFVLAGKSGITIFGSFYGDFAGRAMRDQGFYIKLLDFASQVSLGHIMAIVILYGVPFFIAIQIIYGLLKNGNDNRSPLNKITVFSVLVMANLVLVTAVFTALEMVETTVRTGRVDELLMLHMRYYDFAFPLFYIVAAGGLFAKSARPNLFLHALLALLTGIACHAVYVRMYPFITSGYVHAPDIYAISYNTVVFVFFGIISIVSLGLCFWRVDIAAKVYFSLTVPFYIVSSFYMIVQTRSLVVQPGVADRAGIFAKNYLSLEDRNKLVVAGFRPKFYYPAAFHVNAPGVSMSMLTGNQPPNFTRLPPGKEWILFVGDQVPTGNFAKVLPMNGFTLAQVAGSHVIDFTKPEWPGIRSQKGLTYVENRGAKSVGREIVIEFSEPLPARFDLTILAHARGAKAGKVFTARIGDTVLSFGLKDGGGERVVLRFDNPARSKTLTIEIPPRAEESSVEGRNDSGSGFDLMKLEIKQVL
jgi:phosphoglycerol transferase